MEERNWIFAVLIAAGLAGGGVYMYKLTRMAQVEAPSQHAAEIARTRLTEAALQPAIPKVNAKLYFPSYEEGALIEEQRPIAWAESDADRIRQVVLALVEGSHQGFGRAFPPNSAILGVFVTPDGSAFVNLSEESFADFKSGLVRESLILDSMVNSITVNIPNIKRVRLLVQGRSVDTLDGHADLGGFLLPDLTRVAANP